MRRCTNVFLEGLAEHFGYVSAFSIFRAKAFGPSDKFAVVNLILPEDFGTYRSCDFQDALGGTYEHGYENYVGKDQHPGVHSTKTSKTYCETQRQHNPRFQLIGKITINKSL